MHSKSVQTLTTGREQTRGRDEQAIVMPCLSVADVSSAPPPLYPFPFAFQVSFVNFELPPQDIGTAMKPQQMVDLLEEHIVGQVRSALFSKPPSFPEVSLSYCTTVLA